MIQRLPSVLAALVSLSAIAAWGQDDATSLEILSPEKTEYVRGPIIIEAALDPGERAVKRLIFFGDGKLLCELEAAPYECPFDAGQDVRSHLIRVVAEFDEGPRLVRNIMTPKRAGGFSFRSEVRVVLVPATVTRKGKFVAGLSADAFRVYEDGVQQEIVSFAAHEAPIEFVVAVDASGSMTKRMPEVKRAVRRFLSLLRPADRITLLSFNDEIYTLSRPDAEPEERLRALSQIEPFGRTSLYHAIARSLQTLEKRPGKRAVVVFTDGQDRSSQMSLTDIETMVESGNSVLFMIGTEKAIKDDRLRKVLERLSKRSGGRALLDEKFERLEQAFRDVYQEIRSQYLLAYSPSRQDFDDRWRSIEIELTIKGHKITGREGYRARR